MDSTPNREKRGWLWATLYTVLGVTYVTEGLWDPQAKMNYLLMGVGFLLAVPQAFFSPFRFAKTEFVKVNVVDWFGMVGALFLMGGLVFWWL